MKSICQEHHIEVVSWDDPFLQSDSSHLEEVSHMTSFITFIEGSMKYTGYETDSIRECCRRLVVIDLLPTFLIKEGNNVREIQRFKALLKDIVRHPSHSTLVLWIVDTTDESKGISGVRYLFPSPLPSFFLLQLNPIPVRQ